MIASAAVVAGAIAGFSPSASAAPHFGVTATIPVGGNPIGVGADPSTHTVYVANDNDNTVSVIDETTNTVTATIPVGNSPQGVAVDPSTHMVYVTNYFGTVSVIGEATNTVTATIPVGSDPFGAAVDPSTGRVYVPNGNSKTVSVIDEATSTVTATIPVGNSPLGAAVDPSTHTVYVPNYNDDTVSVISEATNTVTATIPIGAGAEQAAADPSTHTVYVPNNLDGTVSVIDEATNTVTATIPVGKYPIAVGADPSAGVVYIGNFGGDTVSVIDEATNTVTATVPVGRYPQGLAVDPSAHTAYVTNTHDGTVSVITGGQPPSCASPAPTGVLCITSPPDGSTIAATDGKFLTPQPSQNGRQPTARKLTVQGVAPAGDTSITLNGQKVPVTASGTWNARLQVSNSSLGSLTLTAADANTTTQVTITLIDLQVASPAENSSWPITAIPSMPLFNAQAQVAGYSGDTSSLALNWTLNMRGKYINRSGWHKYPQTLFTGSAIGTQSLWGPPQGSPIVGGVGRLSVSATIPGVLDEPVQSEPRWISIPGTDPDPGSVNNLVSSLDAPDAGTIQHLFCWESGGQDTGSYPMFNPAVNSGETALTDVPSDWTPNPPVLQPHLGAPPAGIGIAQLDPATFPGQQWDWTQNVTGGVTMYQQDLAAANKLAGNEQSRLNSERQQALKIADSNRAAANMPPFTPPQKAVVPAEPSYGRVGGVTADAITRYNTGSGYSLFYFDYHYVVSRDGLQVLTVGSQQWIAQDGKWEKAAAWQAAGGATTLRTWIPNPSWNPNYVSQVMGCSL